MANREQARGYTEHPDHAKKVLTISSFSFARLLVLMFSGLAPLGMALLVMGRPLVTPGIEAPAAGSTLASCAQAAPGTPDRI